MQFEIKPMCVNVVVEKVDLHYVYPDPRPQRLLYGHWPFDRIVFPRPDDMIYALIDRHMVDSYSTIEAWLQTRMWLNRDKVPYGEEVE